MPFFEVPYTLCVRAETGFPSALKPAVSKGLRFIRFGAKTIAYKPPATENGQFSWEAERAGGRLPVNTVYTLFYSSYKKN